MAHHIFDECFLNILKKKKKTLLLATHAMSFLRYADNIIVMADGKIEMQGKLQDLRDANINLVKYVMKRKKNKKKKSSFAYTSSDSDSALDGNSNDADLDFSSKSDISDNETGMNLQTSDNEELKESKEELEKIDMTNTDSPKIEITLETGGDTPTTPLTVDMIDTATASERSKNLAQQITPMQSTTPNDSNLLSPTNLKSFQTVKTVHFKSNKNNKTNKQQKKHRSKKKGKKRKKKNTIEESIATLEHSLVENSIRKGKEIKKRQKRAKENLIKEKRKDGELVKEEERGVGEISLALYWMYIKAAGGCLYCLPLLLGMLIFYAATMFGNFWLAIWSDDIEATNATHNSWYYLAYYALIQAVSLVFLLFFLFCYLWARVIASKNVHIRLLKSILKAPMSFFDTTPIGRIGMFFVFLFFFYYFLFSFVSIYVMLWYLLV